jgi:hypothetical protein
MAVAASWLGCLSAPALATSGYAFHARFPTRDGINAQGAAVDQSSNDVYVATPFAFVATLFHPGFIEQFNASGNLLKTFEGVITARSEFPQFTGVAVDPSNHDVYAYDERSQLIDAFDASGNPVDAFEGGTSPSLPVAGGQGAAVQIASDSAGDIYYPNQALGEVQEFQPDGTSGPVTIVGLASPTGVAVAPARIYVVDTNSSTGVGQVQQFDSSGNSVGSGVLGSGVLSNAKAVSVDSSGDVFVLDNSRSGIVVDEFGPTGSLIRTFGAGVIEGEGTSGIAVNSSGEVYVVENAEVRSHGPVSIFAPSPVTTPTALTGSAIGVDPADETVTGTVNPEGTDARYHFDYGRGTAYGQSAPMTDRNAGSVTEDVQAAALLSALEPSQTYHYRLVATNAEGDRTYGSDQTFTTQPATPAVASERTSNVTQSDATLEAQVNPNNQAMSYYFKYGTSPTLSGATTVPLPPGTEIGSSFGEQTASQDIGGGLAVNTTYYYRVVAVNATGATEGSIESFTTLPLAPTAGTQHASSITQTTATLNGTLTTQGAETTYRFQYVDEADFRRSGYEQATSAPQPEIRVGSSPETVSAAFGVSGLEPDTTYRFRLVATNAGGATAGAEQTFSTLVLAPGVATGLPVSMASTAVTVDGGVNPERGETTYRFQYVDQADFLSSGYQHATSVPQPEGNAGATGEAQIVTGTFSGLAPLSTYHYRLVATNAGGTTEGEDETFTTLPEGSQESGGASPFGVGVSIPLGGTVYPVLAGLVPTTSRGAPGINPAPTKQHLTNAEKLANALRACRKRPNRQLRHKCERKARSKYKWVSK